MITKFKIYENFSPEHPNGMDVGLYIFIKENFINSNYEITFTWGSDEDNLDDVNFGVGDEESFLDDTYVNFNDIRFDITLDGITNTIAEFYATTFDIDSLYDLISDVKYNYDMELKNLTTSIIEKYKNTPEYEDWKIKKESGKYNL